MRALGAIAFLLCVAASATAQEIALTGKTFRLRGSGTDYEVLPNVQIVVTRGNAVVRQGQSEKDGTFKMMIPPGPPFTVAFYGEQRVPELQQLAGSTATSNNVNITLLTPPEYQKEFGARMPLADKLACDLRMLPPAADGARAYIQQLMKSVQFK